MMTSDKKIIKLIKEQYKSPYPKTYTDFKIMQKPDNAYIKKILKYDFT
jgi:hypothetical protein